MSACMPCPWPARERVHVCAHDEHKKRITHRNVSASVGLNAGLHVNSARTSVCGIAQIKVRASHARNAKRGLGQV